MTNFPCEVNSQNVKKDLIYSILKIDEKTAELLNEETKITEESLNFEFNADILYIFKRTLRDCINILLLTENKINIVASLFSRTKEND